MAGENPSSLGEDWEPETQAPYFDMTTTPFEVLGMVNPYADHYGMELEDNGDTATLNPETKPSRVATEEEDEFVNATEKRVDDIEEGDEYPYGTLAVIAEDGRVEEVERLGAKILKTGQISQMDYCLLRLQSLRHRMEELHELADSITDLRLEAREVIGSEHHDDNLGTPLDFDPIARVIFLTDSKITETMAELQDLTEGPMDKRLKNMNDHAQKTDEL